jgi:Tfp pilus assembly protein PilN
MEMINLLSTDQKAELRAARVNVFLLRYLGLIILALLFILGALYVSYTVLQETETTAKERIEANDVQSAAYSDTKQRVDALAAKLDGARATLNQSKSYAKVLTTVGQLMPTGTVLGELNLDQAVFAGTPTEIVAYAKTDEEAVAIQQKLQQSPLFTSVSPKGTSSTEGIAEYPIKVTLTVAFNQGGI